jgi:hypothetical protein
VPDGVGDRFLCHPEGRDLQLGREVGDGVPQSLRSRSPCAAPASPGSP